METNNKEKSKKILIGLIMLFMIIIILFISIFYTLQKEKNTNKEEKLSVETSSQEEDVQDLDTKISETENETSLHEENEVYAKILKNEDWIINELQNNVTKSVNEFLVLDINKDGINEMLLRCYGKEPPDGRLTIISYDENSKKIIKQDINMNDSHSSYMGYCSDKMAILTSAVYQGARFVGGHTFDNNECIESFVLSDNTGMTLDEYDQQFKINDEIVSKEKYDKFWEDINKNLSNTEMYPITDENIEKFLEVDITKISNDEDLNKYLDYKFSSVDEAKELIYKEDGNFMNQTGYTILEYFDQCDKDGYFFTPYGLPEDRYYIFNMLKDNGENLDEPLKYMIGQSTGNVYLVDRQPESYMYLIKDNEVIKTLQYPGSTNVTDWRKYMIDHSK